MKIYRRNAQKTQDRVQIKKQLREPKVYETAWMNGLHAIPLRRESYL